MIAIWVHSILSAVDSSTTIHLVELGPGRATLMHDVLQTLKRLKVLPPKMSVHLVEVSTSLRELQKNRLGDSTTKIELGSLPIQWHDTIQSIPNDGTVVFIAHEFFDALPVYQFQVATFSLHY
jgi:NADH dehydrogenase [ubiquinone] 1 alpha subcomplex assembly factor 7